MKISQTPFMAARFFRHTKNESGKEQGMGIIGRRIPIAKVAIAGLKPAKSGLCLTAETAT
jgi:hypothetical protein